MHKSGISTTLGTNPTYISNDYEANSAATALLKPVNSGVQILKDGLYIVVARFVASTTSAGARLSYGIRMYKAASDYADTVDASSSASARTDTYTYTCMGLYKGGIYLRPIASAVGGGICAACSLAVVSLKAE